MSKDAVSLHFVSLNVRGIRDKTKRSKVFSWLRAQKTDIACLQETFWTKELEDKVASEWNGPCYFTNGSNHSKGVSIMIRKNVPLEIVNVYTKDDGRTIALRLVYQNTCYLLLNVYAPTKLSDKSAFFKNLLDWFNNIKKIGDLLICGGDWNTTQTSSLDTRGASHEISENLFKRVNWLMFGEKCTPQRNNLLGAKILWVYTLKVRLLANFNISVFFSVQY